MRRRAGRSAALAGVLLVMVGLSGIAAPAAYADDPTWAEVQAAKHSVAAKTAAVAKIEQALSGLEDEAARLGEVVVQKAAVAAEAESALRTAQARTTELQKQTAAADAKARTARRTAAAVAAQLYQSGDPTLDVWLSGQQSSTLLYKLGALQQISGSSAALLRHATAETREAQSLGAEAAAAAAVRDSLAKRARSAEADARAAEVQAQQQVAATRTRQATLRAQLASLQTQYRSLADSYAAEQAAKAAAAANGDGGGSGGGDLSGIAPGPDSLSPGGAQAYAESRLSAYGWSDGQMSCLVNLWNIESGWRWDAYNASSGAYGIPQSLPGDKMASAGGDWTTSSKTQIEWGLGYIQARYGDPCGALAFETSHVPYWY